MEKLGKLAPTVINESQKNDWKAFTARRKRSKSSSLESVEKSFKKAIQTLEETKNSESLWELFVELIEARVTWGKGSINVGQFLNVISGSKPCPLNVARCFVDSICSFYSENGFKKGKFVAELKEISSEVTQSKAISKELLQTYSSTLDIFHDAKLQQRIKGHRTSLFYKQSTYNLFYEDSEGFAKLIGFFAEVVWRDDLMTFENFCTKVDKMVGRFQLNASRVLDCALHVLELDNNNKLLLQYIQTYNKRDISHILGFKFTGFTLPDTVTTPKSLYKLAVSLITKDIVDIRLVLPHLTPTVKQTIEKRQKVEVEERDAAKNLLRHNLTEKEEERADREKREKDANSKRKKARLEEMPNHQQFELLNQCLQPESFCEKSFEIALYLFNLLEASVPASNLSVRNSILKILDDVVETLYKKLFPNTSCLFDTSVSIISSTHKDGWTSSVFPDVTLKNFPGKIFELMNFLTVYSCASPELCSLICRVLAKHLEEVASPDMTRVQQLTIILCGAFSSMSFNIGMADELWKVISQLNAETRYSIYGFWKNTTYFKYSEMYYIRNEEIKQTKYFMKRYHSDEEDPKKIGRKITKLIHHNPTIVLEEMLTQLQAYSRNINMMADAMRYFNRLTEDILIWECLRQIETPVKGVPRNMIQPDGQVTQWFRAICSLLSHFCKRSASGGIDLTAVIQYVINKLRCGCSVHILMFTDILYQISGIQNFGETITAEQLESLAGPPILWNQSIHNDSKGPSRRTMIRTCIRQMYERDQVMPLFILLAHMKDTLSSGHIDNETESRYPVVADLIDRCNDAFVQLQLFLQVFEKLENVQIGDVLVPLGDLVHQYNVPPELAFHICRDWLGDERVVPIPKTSSMEIEKETETDEGMSAEEEDKEQKDEKMNQFDALIQCCETMLDEKSLTAINPSFYASFWAYRTHDIQCPQREYKRVIEKLEKQLASIKDESSKEGRRLQDDIKKLKENKTEQGQQVKHIKQKNLKKRQNSWLKGVSNPSLTTSTIISKCLIPRLCISDLDAKYCSMFVFFMTNNSTPGFQFAGLIWEITAGLTQILSSTTTAETRRLGRFYLDLLNGIEQFRETSSKLELFVKSPASNLRPEYGLPKIKSTKEMCSIIRLIRAVLTAHIINCLQSPDPRLQKNCIVFITQTLAQFPRIQTNHQKIKATLDGLDAVKDSPMFVLRKRITVMLDKSYPGCLSLEKYGGVDLLSEKHRPKPSEATTSTATVPKKRVVQKTNSTKTKIVSKSSQSTVKSTVKTSKNDLLKKRLQQEKAKAKEIAKQKQSPDRKRKRDISEERKVKKKKEEGSASRTRSAEKKSKKKKSKKSD